MEQQQNNIIVPRFYQPRPYQLTAWRMMQDPDIWYYIQLWHRQAGKDTDMQQRCLNWAWWNPGTQSTYIGLDNVWVTNNIFKKYIDNRTFWAEYPEDLIDVKDTVKEVYFTNNPKDKAPARIKYIGFLNDQQLIGSSYDRFYISEASLYGKDAFQYITPIWENKIQSGAPLFVNFNGTPRGTRNVFYELIKNYTGIDDPEGWPGKHKHCFVDKVTVYDSMVPDGKGGFRRLYSDEAIEQEQDWYMRAYGNLNLWKQEKMCEFGTVNAGLVYLGIEQLEKEGRYCRFNLDSSKPVYVAFDIASKGAVTDATAAVIYQYINNMLFIYDIYEARGKSLVECIAEVSARPYFHLIRLGALPWDSDRSASSETPLEEARKMFPNINWHQLDKERVDRGIQEVRKMLPNMFINKDKCGDLMEAFNNYEYKYLEKQEDWTPKPVHSKYSHLMDAVRYGVMAIKEIEYYGMNNTGTYEFQTGLYGTMHSKPETRRGEVDNGYYSYQGAAQ